MARRILRLRQQFLVRGLVLPKKARSEPKGDFCGVKLSNETTAPAPIPRLF
jgi:hypothetical protein